MREFDECAARDLAAELGICPITARVLVARGISRPDEAARFLSPSLDQLPDPSALPGIDAAAERIEQALRDGKLIAIFGDYDADGITAAALLAEFLEAAGGRVVVRLPSRHADGYGLSNTVVDSLASDGVSLIVTVDNGTSAVEAIERANSHGIDVVVTDHHDAAGVLPRAIAIVNPKIDNTDPAFAHISGCGVAFLLAIALRRRLRDKGLLPVPEPNLKQVLDLVAIGTIADVVPLIGANRIFARVGLEELSLARRTGVRALIESAALSTSELSPHAVAFRLAPRINAAGRMGEPDDALALLRCRNDAEAGLIAARLESANRERQCIEERVLGEAMEMLQADQHDIRLRPIVVHKEGWHQGVIGIVAAKLAERSMMPAIVISSGVSPARGSARSRGGVNLVEALGKCSDCLVRFGGHPMAAGLAIEPSRIPEFEERFLQACIEIGPKDRAFHLELDSIAEPGEISEQLVRETLQLGPFGAGNPEPIMALGGARVLDRRVLCDAHLKLRLEAGNRVFSAIGFGMAKELPSDVTRVHVAFTPQFNTWNGLTSIQLKLAAISPA